MSRGQKFHDAVQAYLNEHADVNKDGTFTQADVEAAVRHAREKLDNELHENPRVVLAVAVAITIVVCVVIAKMAC